MNIREKAIKYVTDKQYRFMAFSAHHLYDRLPDEEYLKRIFRIRMHYELNLDEPRTFNEKLQWLKIYNRKDEYTLMSDKYEVKKYVSDIIGTEYIIPTYGVWEKAEDIEFGKLPSQFVLKCTHDSGGIEICRDKSKLNVECCKKRLNECLKKNYYLKFREWAYKDIKPRIIAEKYMKCKSEDSLIDYKFFCFNGEPLFICVSKGLENHATAVMGFYDLDGKEMSFYRSDYKPYHGVIMPIELDEMKRISKRLAKEVNSPFVRIDLYSINSQVYFSEITFFPCAGMIPFEPATIDIKLGKLIKLENEQKHCLE